MGLGLLNGIVQPSLDGTFAYASDALDAALQLAEKLVKYGPIITPAVGAVAGVIALYSIRVTRDIARRRAAIDFFLKTEADKSMVDTFQKFDESAECVKSYIEKGMSLREVVATKEYKVVHTCLNIHELIAVGIDNKVFDKKVCYNYWSGALVGHCKQAKEIIDFSRAEEDDASAYISMLELNKEWKKKLERWTSRHRRDSRVPMITGPIVPPKVLVAPAR